MYYHTKRRIIKIFYFSFPLTTMPERKRFVFCFHCIVIIWKQPKEEGSHFGECSSRSSSDMQQSRQVDQTQRARGRSFPRSTVWTLNPCISLFGGHPPIHLIENRPRQQRIADQNMFKTHSKGKILCNSKLHNGQCWHNAITTQQCFNNRLINYYFCNSQHGDWSRGYLRYYTLE